MPNANDSGYFFLGIVSKDDLQKGIIEPSYVLCKSSSFSENRSGLRVARVDGKMINAMQRLLVTSINKHDELVDFLSAYRTRDHMHGDKHYRHDATKKYYPEGAIFWFPCSTSGVIARRTLPIFVKLVPDTSVKGKTDDGFTRLKEAMARKPTLRELINREPNGWLYPESIAKRKRKEKKRRKRKWKT